MISEKFKKSLFGQGWAALTSDDGLDPNITAEEFITRWESGEAAQESFRKKLQYYCANVAGTDQYWASKGKEFLATALCHSVIEKREPTLFHTVSHAEFNDPHLHWLMAKYVAKITNDVDMERKIMDDRAAWAQSIHKYKNVVTHYFACKLELWIICFLVPVLNLKHINETKEFGSSRGAIHTHMIGYTDSKGDKAIDQIMSDWAIEAMQASILYKREIQVTSTNVGPIEQSILDSAKKVFDDALSEAKRVASNKLHDIITKHFGISAVHIGHAPKEYVMPGGKHDMGYRSSFLGMQTCRDVLQKNEVSFAKFEREETLYERRVNLQNQCLTHCCSDYCLRMVGTVTVEFDRRYHKDEHSFIAMDEKNGQNNNL